ncbi:MULTISPECIES: bacteriohopanetetrol glucosamine biosynthesis glycosyltransferase HpnI [Acidobacteriaceae]|uniref:bacteriohopanetetrol glucosamine biosynthesis glycosyltransferase HpnI n=1 Tax=Acidobacteriaceae TaxID=204434 RepID=UPI00131D105F|nr:MULTISPECIES: bacteriohopanetetrol glucosamine biosynthesis glycosyltransferase HpnI [Acidobacteriaceae]MDW5265733.1 bacteriohopanetetrol glucosamine biosynthesis glycosyltransferase HpnI [Edaphobacter sp.]
MATAIEAITTLLTLAGLAYLLLALWGTRDFAHYWMRRPKTEGFAPDVSILKPVKGVDPQMYAGLVSHCRQQYAGNFEILFGVSSMDDPAVEEIRRLQTEFPDCVIRLVECRERLGTSGKVSNLVQMLREARYEHVLINDSDIYVSPLYLTRVMACFADASVGMVTAPYIGRTAETGSGRTLWSRLEALGISTDFLPGVLTARKLEHGIRFGLGSTLAMSWRALAKAGGLEPLTEYLADDYEMGARIAAAGYRVELSNEVVDTTVPAYRFRGFCDHQLRWSRSTRDSRKLGYVGLGITYALPWALMNCVASGFALWSFSLLSVVVLARVAVALSVGVGILRDGQVLRDLWLLPLRDFFGLGFWAWSFADDTVVWRGERFHLRNGRITRA